VLNATHIAVALFFCAALPAQTGLQFEVASVRPLAPNFGADATVTAGLRVDGAQFDASMPLRNFVAVAYKAHPHQFEAPEWMASQWYEVAATLPEGHSKGGEVLEMLRALLVERFHIKMHRETKELPIYALTLTKSGITAKEDPLDPVGSSAEAVSTSSETRSVSTQQRGVAVTMGEDKIEDKKFTMSMLASQLTGIMDRPVVDQTGLEADAAYDLILELTHEDFLATRVRSAINGGMTPPPQAMKLLEASGDSLDMALAKIGLKLEAKKASLEVLVIDSSDKVPGEN
jgi:uncharacterized protein (TIGR03435 family)